MERRPAMVEPATTRRAVLQAGALATLGGFAASWSPAQAQETAPSPAEGSAPGSEAAAPPEDASPDIEKARKRHVAAAIQAAAEPLPEVGAPDFAAFADRFKDARVVLLGESTHGTDEFYRARAAITERLVTKHGFTIVAVEADWPDAARVDAYVRGRTDLPAAALPFQRFPTWMWRNRAVRDFVDRLHAIN